MSQHHFDTTHNGQPVTVTMGFDRPLRGFFMYVSAGGVPSVYCNLDDPALAACGGLPPTLEPFLARLRELGLQVPAKMITEVKRDQIHQVGNRVVVYPGGGPMAPSSGPAARLGSALLGPIRVTLNEQGVPFGLTGNESKDLVLRVAHYGVECGRITPTEPWTVEALQLAIADLASNVKEGYPVDAYIGHAFLGTSEH